MVYGEHIESPITILINHRSYLSNIETLDCIYTKLLENTVSPRSISWYHVVALRVVDVRR